MVELEWFKQPCHWCCSWSSTENESYCQAVGRSKDDLEGIEASWIIKALDKVVADKKRGNNRIKGIRVYHGRVNGTLNIRDAKELEWSVENDSRYIKIPVAELIFNRTVFEDSIDFRSAQFGERTSFRYAQFGKSTDFSYAKFGESTDFSYARFGENTDFIFAQFGKSTYFSYAKFGESTYFSYAKFKSIAYFGAVSYWSDSLGTTLSRWLWKIRVRGKISEYVLPENSPEGKPPEKVNIDGKKYEGTQFFLDSQYIDEVTSPFFKRYIADQQFLRAFKEKHRRVYWLWRWTSDCGRSIKLWAFWSVLFAFMFALAYTPSPDWMPEWWCDFWQKYGAEFQQIADTYKDKTLNFWSCFYFSIVTFTTLGFGDVITNNTFARFLVTLEVILGYIMLGGLISIFANKLARRS